MKKLFLLIIFALAVGSTVNAANRIVVSKEKLVLWVITADNDTIFSAPISCGVHLGQKWREGDQRTPEGDFKIRTVEKSIKWTWDFHDGKGKVKGAYGPYFMRLNVPNNTTIGIHGTCKPETIGSRSSSGCIRMHNDDILRLKELVGVGTPVTILPDRVVCTTPTDDPHGVSRRLSLPGRISLYGALK